MKRTKWIAILAAVALAACGGEADESQRIPLGEPDASEVDSRADWPEGLSDRVNDANTAYAEERFQDAAEAYREMTSEYPDNGTLWFGLYMAESALGNEDAATAAMERVEELTPGLAEMHGHAEDMTEMMSTMDSAHQGMMQDGG